MSTSTRPQTRDADEGSSLLGRIAWCDIQLLAVRKMVLHTKGQLI